MSPLSLSLSLSLSHSLTHSLTHMHALLHIVNLCHCRCTSCFVFFRCLSSILSVLQGSNWWSCKAKLPMFPACRSSSWKVGWRYLKVCAQAPHAVLPLRTAEALMHAELQQIQLCSPPPPFVIARSRLGAVGHFLLPFHLKNARGTESERCEETKV